MCIRDRSFSYYGPLAQQVEQGTLNPKVTGSIPVRPTTPKAQYEAIRSRSSRFESEPRLTKSTAVQALFQRFIPPASVLQHRFWARRRARRLLVELRLNHPV